MRNWPRLRGRKRLVIGLGCLMVCGAVLRGEEGKLDRFEKSFQPSGESTSNSGSDRPRSRRSYRRRPSSWDERLLEGLGYGFVLGGANAQEVASVRGRGNPILPVLNVRGGWQWTSSDVRAYDYGIEGGYGVLAGDFRHTRFEEEGVDGHLDLIQAHVLYRMAITDRIEWGVGFGGAWLRGDQTEAGVSFASPVRWWPLEWLGLEVRPAWTSFNGVGLTDVDAGVLLRYQQVVLRAGYRWLEVEDDAASLGGARIGLGWRF